MTNILMRTEKLCKSFSVGGLQQHVLKNLDIELYKGDFTVIMGSSGSGKSTLLYALGGLDKPTIGSIEFDKRCLTELNHEQLAIFRRRHCGFVFQQIHLLDNMSILDNVLASGLLVQKNRKALLNQAKELLLQVGIPEQYWIKFPAQLSGGEAQRVGIVRAMINQPSILFADEPTGALNSSSSNQVLEVFSHINGQGQSIVMVTHDIKSALRGNRILYLKDGMISGELHLDPYCENADGERQNQLKAFLTEMGW